MTLIISENRWFWEVPVCLKEELILLLNDKDCAYDVRIQIQQFLEER